MSDEVRFGRYVLEKRLAVGGMAEVFLGRVEGPDGFAKRVVIKRILSALGDDGRFVQMFLDEARLAARFDHPNLVHIYELTKLGEQYALVMEYINGIDLDELVERNYRAKREIPFDVAAFIIAEAAEGLHWAHELRSERGELLGVVHRDVSPANVIVTWNGRIKMVDFGIAKHRQSSVDTESGVLKGKYSYMSPEQAQGLAVDRRSDIFSLGAVFYELLTLERCFTRKSPMDTLNAVTSAQYAEARSWRADIPEDLDAILNRMLARRMDNRFASAADASRELRRWLAATSVPQAQDVSRWLEGIFGPPERSDTAVVRGYTAVSSDEVQVTEDLARPTVAVDRESWQRIVAAEPMGDDTTTVPVFALAADAPPTHDTQITPTPMFDTSRTEIVSSVTAIGMLAKKAQVAPTTIAWAAAILGVALVIMIARIVSSPSRVPRVPEAVPATSNAPLRLPEVAVVVPAAHPPEPPPQPAPVPPRAPPPAPAPEPEAAPEPVEAMEEEPDSAPSQPAPDGIGYLSLSAEPPMEVTIDGRRVGSTPLRAVSLPAGRRSVVLKNPKLGLSRSVSLQVVSGKTIARRIVIDKGRVALQITPWAHVFLRGEKIGTTPMAPFALYEGVHDIELTNPELGIKKVRRITVRGGQTVKLVESFQ